MVFAEVSDIEARYGELSASDEIRADVLIEDASAWLAAMVDVDISDIEQMRLLKIVCCSMVWRVLGVTEADSYGVSSLTTTAGVYSETRTFSNPNGNWYLTRQEKHMLGIGGKVGAIRPKIGGGCYD